MSIVEQLTPTQYRPIRLVIEIAPDTTLTTDSISPHADIRILNTDGQQLGIDNPTPQTTQAELSMFLAWVQNNLAAYETATGLGRYTEEE